MGYYPIMMDLTDKPCLVVGGGKVALRKVKSLLEAGARVTLISPEIDKELAESGIEILQRSFEPGDTLAFKLVFAATDSRELNARISEEAAGAGIPVNVVDDPELCSFIVPAVVRRSDLVISVSTGGKSPALAKKIRKELEEIYGREYSILVDLLGEIRELVKEKYDTQNDRERVFNKLLESGIDELLKQGKEREAREKAFQCI